jgi:hypothetical protein
MTVAAQPVGTLLIHHNEEKVWFVSHIIYCGCCGIRRLLNAFGDAADGVQ